MTPEISPLFQLFDTPFAFAVSSQQAIHRPNAGLMLGRRRRRRANINPALGQCIVFSGTLPYRRRLLYQCRNAARYYISANATRSPNAVLMFVPRLRR